MNVEERMLLFSEQIMCGAEISTWHYNASLELLESNCPKAELLDATLQAFGGKEDLRKLAVNMEKPVVLSIPIGLMWCADSVAAESEDQSLYVIGPVWSTDASLSTNLISMEQASRERGVSLEWLREMDRAQRELPVVIPILMYQYALILHCTLTGEKLSISDIVYQQSHGMTEPEEKKERDRYRTWRAEQAMLKMVKEGDLGFAKAFNKAANLSKGVPLDDGNALRQAKTSVIVFTSLCTRAAIEGGLSPEEAYSLGDGYIRSIENCYTISEAAAFSYGMYSDFVNRVHNRRVDKSVSSHIRAVCDYVEMHADEPLTNEDLARRAGYSEQYLRRKFTKEVGVSLPDYIRAVRVERAKNLLLYSEWSIQEIADRLQFCSRGHFSEVFRKSVGVTPARYREQQR